MSECEGYLKSYSTMLAALSKAMSCLEEIVDRSYTIKKNNKFLSVKNFSFFEFLERVGSEAHPRNTSCTFFCFGIS